MRGALVLAGLALSFGASAQQPAPPLKGKIKPGLYEVKTEADMGTMPGVPADQKKQVSTRQQCLTAAEVDKLTEESAPNCKTSGLKMLADGATFRVTCTGAQEMTADVRINYTNAGYVTESKVSMKPAKYAPAATMSQRVTSKYVGACPAAAPRK